MSGSTSRSANPVTSAIPNATSAPPRAMTVARGSAHGRVPDTIAATGETPKTFKAPNQMNTTPSRMRSAGSVAGRTVSATEYSIVST